MQSVLAGFRLSLLQRRLWRSSQDPVGFLSQAAVVLSGPLDQAVLETAIRRTAEQHEVLRTVFPRLPGMDIPLQEVKEIPSFDFREIAGGPFREDGDGLPLAALLAREAGRELDLERGPLFLCTLCPVAPQSSLLLLTLPAVCGDAETMHNLVREIARHYQAALTGASPDRELTQYIDFSEWQNDLGEMEESEKGRTFWKQQNLASLPSLELPFAAPSSTMAGMAGGGTRRVVVEIGSAAGADARAEQALLLAVWKALLWP